MVKEQSTTDTSLGVSEVLGRAAQRTVFHDSLAIRGPSTTLRSGLVLVLNHFHGLVFVSHLTPDPPSLCCDYWFLLHSS